MKKSLLSLILACCLTMPGLQYVGAVTVVNNTLDHNKDIDYSENHMAVLKPHSPTVLNANCTGAGVVTLTWQDNSTNEDGFVIERRPQNWDDYDEIDRVPANTCSYVQSQTSSFPVFPGEFYYYRVKATRGSLSSAYSNECWVAVTDSGSPIAPGNLKVTGSYKGGLIATWDDRSNNETGFVVEYKKQGEQQFAATEDTLASNTTQYEMPLSSMPEISQNRGTVYHFRVKVFNNTGSAYSNTANYTVPTYQPAAPVLYNYGIYLTNPSTMSIQWLDKSDNEDGFIVARGPISMDLTYTYINHVIAQLDKNATSYEDKNLPPDQLYKYCVFAYTSVNTAMSSQVQAPITGPQTPTVNATAVSQTAAKISWSCPTTGVDFKLERKTTGGQYQMIHNWFYASENISEYTDNNLTPGQTYYYKLSAGRNCAIYALASTETSVTLPTLASIVDKPDTVLNTGALKVIKVNLGQTNYEVDNQQLHMDTAPIMYQNRTMLPISYIAGPLGAELSWDASDQKVTIELGNKKIELWIGKNTALVNGKETPIDSSNPEVMPIMVPPGRTMLPLGFVATSLGCQVEWDQNLQQAKVTYSP